MLLLAQRVLVTCKALFRLLSGSTHWNLALQNNTVVYRSIKSYREHALWLWKELVTSTHSMTVFAIDSVDTQHTPLHTHIVENRVERLARLRWVCVRWQSGHLSNANDEVICLITPAWDTGCIMATCF